MYSLQKFIVILWILWMHPNNTHQKRYEIWVITKHSQHTEDKLNVTVYYETLCPGSAAFVSQYVKSAWSLLKDYVNFLFIPYGNAQQVQMQNGTWNFTCQHGPNECLGNKIQSCGLHYLQNDPDQQVKFVTCFMSHNIFPFNLTCFRNRRDKTKFRSCIKSKTLGDDLMAKNGNLTHSVNPPLQGVPAISFNGIHNYTLENEARNDLKGTICQLLKNKPKVCETI